MILLDAVEPAYVKTQSLNKNTLWFLDDMALLNSHNITQVNRMSRSRRVLAIGGKQRIYGLDMVCIETILFHLESF